MEGARCQKNLIQIERFLVTNLIQRVWLIQLVLVTARAVRHEGPLPSCGCATVGGTRVSLASTLIDFPKTTYFVISENRLFCIPPLLLFDKGEGREQLNRVHN
jgi:hypothetical protein